MHTYANYFLRLDTGSLPKEVQRFIEEVLVSPYVLNKNCLFSSTNSLSIYHIWEHINETADKNKLFDAFLLDAYALSSPWQNFREDFMKVFAAALARGKKMLLLVDDFGERLNAGISPLITNRERADEFIRIVNTYKDYIILMMFSNRPSVITKTYIELMASLKFKLVHIKLPDRNSCEKLLQSYTSRAFKDKDGSSFGFNFDHQLVVEKMIGADSGIIQEFMNRATKQAIQRAITGAQDLQVDVPMHAEVTMEDVLQAMRNGKVNRDLDQPFVSVVRDKENLKSLKSMVNSHPEDLELIELSSTYY